jgi:hypothetical protein
MTTIFANVLNIRITPSELVLEFGSFFPDRAPVVGIAPSPPSDYKPEVRVVLNPSVLPGLAEAMKKGAEQVQANAATQAAAKRPVGFATE